MRSFSLVLLPLLSLGCAASRTPPPPAPAEAALTPRPTAGFVARYRDLPRERLAEAGREVLDLPEAEVFEEVR